MTTSLICTLGGSTPVVTETIDALLDRGMKVDKVIVVHTATDSLKEKKAGQFDLSLEGLRKDLKEHYKGRITSEFVELPFEDIITEKDNDKLLRVMFETIAREKSRADLVYLSIAGGRKTMSAMALFAGYFTGCDGIFHIITRGNEFELSREFGLHVPSEKIILIDVPLIDLSPVWKSAALELGNTDGKRDSLLELISKHESATKGVSDLSRRLITTLSGMKLAEDYQRLFPVFNNLCAVVSAAIERRLSDLKIRRPDIQHRVKTLANIRRNIIRYGDTNSKVISDPLHELRDISAARIICYTARDAKKVCDLIESGKVPEFSVSGREEHKKKMFGYRAVHYQLKANKGSFSKSEFAVFRDLECELQVKTIFAHSWATLEHSVIYKSESFGNLDGKTKERLEEKFIRIGAQLKAAEDEFDLLLEETEGEIRKLRRKNNMLS